MATALQQSLGDPATWPLEPWSSFFDGNMVALAQCPVCGAAVRNAQTHYSWHITLGQ